MRSSTPRLIAVAALTSLLLAAIGFSWSAGHYGLSDDASAARLEREVRQLVANRGRQVQALAERVSGDGGSVAAATAAASREDLARLFSRLKPCAIPAQPGAGPPADPACTELAGGAGFERNSVTVWVPARSPSAWRVLAWSDGPAEEVTADRLAGPAALFVAPGTGGLRLVFVQPIESGGQRVGTAAAETILSPSAQVGNPSFSLDTALGPVEVRPPPYADAGQTTRETRSFVITSHGDTPLMEVRFSIEDLAARRRMAYRRGGALAALPFVALGLLLSGRVIQRRARTRRAGVFLGWSTLAALIVGVSALVLERLARLVGASAHAGETLLALALFGAAALLPVSMWWRAWPRRRLRTAPLRFAAEHAIAGLGLAATLIALSRVLHDRINASSLDSWEFPLFPVDADGLLYLAGLMLIQLALCWAMAAALAAVAARWRLTWRRPAAGVAAAALWLAPSAAVILAAASRRAITDLLVVRLPPVSPVAWMVAATLTAVFALLATSIRRYYRHTTQAMRLVLVFGALFLPAAALYPMATFYADTATQALVAQNYSAATAEHPQRVRAQLAQVQEEIDRLPGRAELVAPGDSAMSSHRAFVVWSATSLARTRVTSDVELYGANRALISRFALNMPEYAYSASRQPWSGTGCAWNVFDDTRRFGADSRIVFHAERGVCDAEGHLLGAVVVHAVPDYQALPFVSSASFYPDVLAASEPAPRESRLADLQVVVYGWSLRPVFAPGVAWPITDALLTRLAASRDGFWTTIPAAGRVYRVYFANNRGGIYALGYPLSTRFEHATRLAEAAALTAIIFVVLLLGAAVYAPFAGRRDAPLRVLFNEIRTSFYRKLFLFFVLAAVGPVIMLALAFGAYMTGQFRLDVVAEATTTVAVARRVFEELAAAEQRQNQPIATPSDDVMVWIGQVIHHHVNLFEGPQLTATSQRDLFDSGLLPTRTPAAAYRAIVLDRLPTFVAEDRLASFQYLVAAAPVPVRGRDAVLSVPLANRQRDIEREIDDLNRGVLVGAIVVILFGAGLGASVAGRISDPVARLTRATRQIAAGRLDVRIVADTADELRRLVDDFNSMAATLGAQRAELARTNQLKAWNEMARQVAHEIKNPLTPIQLSAEHLQRVHDDAQRPLGPVFDHCIRTILQQVRLLRQIAAEFSNFAGEPSPRPASVALGDLVEDVLGPYRTGLRPHHHLDISVPAGLPLVWVDRTLIARAITNLVENALHAMPDGGTLRVAASPAPGVVTLTVADTGVGMDDEALRRAFEPYFSTKTAGSGLGLANAKRNVELCGGSIAIASEVGRGTTLTISLPVAPPRGAGAGAQSPGP